MFDSRDVAAYIAQECKRREIEYNNTKIQKLLYCSYGVMLAWKDERICEEYPRLWPYGPVFPKVFKFIHEGKDIATFSTLFEDSATRDQRTVVSRVIDRYGQFSAVALSEWSHKPHSPWAKTKDEGAPWNSFIPDNYISDYFREHVIARS